MTEAEKLKLDIERCAETLGLAPSTIGERIGQGGQFYARLCAGKRIWPETAAKSRAAMENLLQKVISDNTSFVEGVKRTAMTLAQEHGPAE